ncbi:hypothetical protein A3L08_06315 [Thermococcus pacificus]|uniref:Prenyltransferase n=2 Tax=Thermococcus pacificus TaxID=71998 RepID=A0A218P857_9EURY|nr:hypothetical protein A3L08_06315 [Thermococcus pacificus]
MFVLFGLSSNVALVGVLYLLLNIMYSYFLKRLFLIDVIAISIGYLLRTIAGAQVIDVPVSNWLVFSVFQVALILAFHKRRCELNVPSSIKHRNTLGEYTPGLIINLSTMTTASLVVTYLIYINEVNPKLVFTIPLVFYGVFRLEYLLIKCETDFEPQYLRDMPLIATLISWVVLVVISLYLL